MGYTCENVYNLIHVKLAWEGFFGYFKALGCMAENTH